VTIFTDEMREPQALSTAIASVVWRCVDGAESPSDAKAMILEMYERGPISRRDCTAQIAARGLASE